MFDTILFDLDGTLSDPKVGITMAASIALRHFGIEENPDNLCWMIGPPLHDSFRDHYNMTDEQADEAVREYRVYFGSKGWAENVPYEGMSGLLGELKAMGKKLAVATSKPEEYSRRILDHFDMAKYFDVICGAPFYPPEACKKPRIIARALTELGVQDPSSVIMVGDRKHDVEGAHENRIPCIGVLYGYGDRAELECAEADFITETVQSLGALLKK